MIVVLFWALLAWFSGLAGSVGNAWWGNAEAIGNHISHSGVGAITGLFVVATLMLGLGGVLRRGWRMRQVLGAGAVTLAILDLGVLGGRAWLTSLSLLMLGVACTWGPGAMNAAVLTLIGLVLGGSRQVKSIVITATSSSHMNQGDLQATRLAIVVALIAIGVGAVILSAQRVGVFGEAFLMRRWQQWGWKRGGGTQGGTAVKAGPVAHTGTVPGTKWRIWRGRDGSA